MRLMTNKGTVRKVLLISFGILLPLLVIETGFRLAGSWFMLRQSRENRKDLFNNEPYRILCLGESTTQEQWPPALQNELNKNSSGIQFKIIDKGVGGTNTAMILWHLAGYLDTFKPQMVVVMMGINDGRWIWRKSVEYEEKPAIKLELFLRNLRINKLATLITEGLEKKWNRIRFLCAASIKGCPQKQQDFIELGDLYRDGKDYEKAKQMYKAGIEADPNDPDAYIALGSLTDSEGACRLARDAITADPRNPKGYLALADLREDGSFKQHVFETLIEANPQSPVGHVELGNMRWRMGDNGSAVDEFNVAIKVDQEDPQGYIGLANIYLENGRTEDALHACELAIKVNPRRSEAHLWLGDFYRGKRDYATAERMYEAGVNADALNPEGYFKLGDLYREMGRDEKAVTSHERGIKVAPRRAEGYIRLADLYRGLGKKRKAIRLYKEGIKASPLDAEPYVALARFFRDHLEYEKAEQVLRRGYFSVPNRELPLIKSVIDDLYLRYAANKDSGWDDGLPPPTVRNYRKLKEIILSRGIRLVCMQYPRREVKILKDMLGTTEGIIYVENRQNFEEALSRHKATDIFVDMFGGDFGHCTQLGNRIIAENLANTILREVFSEVPLADGEPGKN